MMPVSIVTIFDIFTVKRSCNKLRLYSLFIVTQLTISSYRSRWCNDAALKVCVWSPTD